MKPYPFEYYAAESVDHVTQLLNQHGDEAQVLAGGQSLIPTLNMRLSAPALLIDINPLTHLAGVAICADALSIGAMTRHVDVLESPLVAQAAPVLCAALNHVAHPAIRNRGTLGGSIALADPAAELPACAVALNARIVLTNRAGERRVLADAFFRGLYETARAADELLTAVEFPLVKSTPMQWSFQELARRHGDFALTGLVAGIGHNTTQITAARLVFFAVGDKPSDCPLTAHALCGRSVPLGSDVAAELAPILNSELSPLDQPQASAATKRQWAQVLLQRALKQVSVT